MESLSSAVQKIEEARNALIMAGKSWDSPEVIALQGVIDSLNFQIQECYLGIMKSLL